MTREKSNEPDTGNIIFEDIDDKYAYGKVGNFDVIIMKQNGYINATKLCKDGEKEFFHWKENKTSKEFINALQSQLGISNWVYSVAGGKITKIRGTYVHPLLITHIAYWCSTEFAVNISIWIEEWKKYSTDNETKYWKTLVGCESKKNNTKEKIIQKKLKKKLGGESEIETDDDGFIDILTESEIIEIKEYGDWKCALGQILAYGVYYPDNDKIIYLFDVPKKNNIKDIRKTCNKYDVQIIIYN